MACVVAVQHTKRTSLGEYIKVRGKGILERREWVDKRGFEIIGESGREGEGDTSEKGTVYRERSWSGLDM